MQYYWKYIYPIRKMILQFNQSRWIHQCSIYVVFLVPSSVSLKNLLSMNFLIKHRKPNVQQNQNINTVEWSGAYSGRNNLLQPKPQFGKKLTTQLCPYENYFAGTIFMAHSCKCQVQISWQQDGWKVYSLISFLNYPLLQVWLHVWPNYKTWYANSQ